MIKDTQHCTHQEVGDGYSRAETTHSYYRSLFGNAEKRGHILVIKYE